MDLIASLNQNAKNTKPKLPAFIMVLMGLVNGLALAGEYYVRMLSQIML